MVPQRTLQLKHARIVVSYSEQLTRLAVVEIHGSELIDRFTEQAAQFDLLTDIGMPEACNTMLYVCSTQSGTTKLELSFRKETARQFRKPFNEVWIDSLSPELRPGYEISLRFGHFTSAPFWRDTIVESD